MERQECQEGHDGTVVTYRERLAPPWWAWVLGGAFATGVGVAYGFALGAASGVLAAVLLAAGSAGLLVTTVAVVAVDECGLRAGRARLPLQVIGTVTPLDAAASAVARTRDFDPRAFVLLRTWAAASSIRVEVCDARDPHPYWLVSTRDPEALTAAIHAAQGGTLGSSEVGQPSDPGSDGTDPAVDLHSSRETP